MTDFSSGLRSDIDQAIKWGNQCRIKYYNATIAGSYDDVETLTQSGTDTWISGFPQPVTVNSPTERLLIEQGNIEEDDLKLYLNGLVAVSGNIKIGLGSPTTDEYRVLDQVGINTQKVSGQPVYHKLFLRRLQTGSLQGE